MLKLNTGKYVFIGHKLYEFIPDNEIVAFYSFVGNSDVPYPIAIDSKDNFYLLMEEKDDDSDTECVMFNKSSIMVKDYNFKENMDIYGYYYCDEIEPVSSFEFDLVHKGF